jgi:hypothetical protein
LERFAFFYFILFSIILEGKCQGVLRFYALKLTSAAPPRHVLQLDGGCFPKPMPALMMAKLEVPAAIIVDD